MTGIVVPFVRVGDAIKRNTVICTECNSRAMRIVTGDDEQGWAVECHNCGELLEDLKVEWETSGTLS